MPVSLPEALEAVITLRSAIPWMPDDERFSAILARSLTSFVNNLDELSWLLRTVVQVWPKWKSIAELRGLYSARYYPADGIYGVPPRFSQEDAERSHFDREAAETERRFQEYRCLTLAAPAQDGEPLLLSKGCEMPAVGGRKVLEPANHSLVETLLAINRGFPTEPPPPRPSLRDLERQLEDTKLPPRDAEQAKSMEADLSRMLIAH